MLINMVSAAAAFDKTDLLYLRDSELQQRHVELHQRESELSTFAAMRARIEAEAEAAEASGAAASGPAPRAQQQAAKQPPLPQKRSLLKPLVPGVVIKPVPSRGAPSPAAALVPPAKRPKLDTVTAAEPSRGEAGQAAAGKAGAAAGSKPAAESTDRVGKADAEALAGLLGGYGSDEEGSSGSDHSNDGKEPAARGSGGGGAPRVPAAKLPDAAALLQDVADPAQRPEVAPGMVGSSLLHNGHDRGSDDSSGSSNVDEDA